MLYEYFLNSIPERVPDPERDPDLDPSPSHSLHHFQFPFLAFLVNIFRRVSLKIASST
jgi:hypothetical protein